MLSIEIDCLQAQGRSAGACWVKQASIDSISGTTRSSILKGGAGVDQTGLTNQWMCHKTRMCYKNDTLLLFVEAVEMVKSPLHVGKRSREVVEILYKLGEGSVSDVRAQIVDPPGYSAVRGVLNGLVMKRILKTRQSGKKLLYRPAVEPKSAGRSALRRVLESFFEGRASSLIAALLDDSNASLSEEELERIRRMIVAARSKGR